MVGGGTKAGELQVLLTRNRTSELDGPKRRNRQPIKILAVTTLPEALGRRPGLDTQPDVAEQPLPARTQQAGGLRIQWDRERLRPLVRELRFPLAVYVATRLLFVLIALADTVIHGTSFGRELANWDGVWYL